MSTPLLHPPIEDDYPDAVLTDQLTRWSRMSSWAEASSFAQALADRDSRNESRLRNAAEAAERAGDDRTCVVRLQALSALVELTPDDWIRWVTALLRLTANAQAAFLLSRSRLAGSSQWGELDFASRAWRELQVRTSASEANEAESEWQRQRAWSALLAMVPLAQDETAARQLLNRMWEWRSSDEMSLGSPTFDAFVAATQQLASNVPECRGLAALMLARDEPQWTLQVRPLDPKDVDLVQARFHAHWARQEFQLAMIEGERFASLGGSSLLKMPVENVIRFQWARTLTEVGRLHEAEEACAVALEPLRVLDRDLSAQLKARESSSAPDQGTPAASELAQLQDHWRLVRQLRCLYAIERGRTAYLRGRFDEAWPQFLAVAKLDHEVLDIHTRISLAHLGVITAPDLRSAARELVKLDTFTEKIDAVMGGQLDTALIEGCLWVSGRWESSDGTWDALADSGLDKHEASALRRARSRALVRARELLAAVGDQVGVAQQMRAALLAGDELQAEALAAHLPADLAQRWDGRVLQAVLELQAGRDLGALKLLRSVMAERRFDTDLRVLYAHAALLAGHAEEAAQECLEIVEMVPEHIMARVVRAECAFELALRSDRGAAPQALGEPEGRTAEAVAMENVQELILAVADYHEAARLDYRTKEFLRLGYTHDGQPSGSDFLTPRQVMQVCRRGLHAAVIAQEGLDRLGLRRDRQLERQAAHLVRYMRAHRPHRVCESCKRPHPSWLAERLHRGWHLLNRDEAARLSHLMTGYRWASRRRFARFVLLVTMGVVLSGAVLFDVGQINERVDGLAMTTVRVAVLAAGLVLILIPFVRTVKVGVFEVHRPDRAPPINGRSKALRASVVLQRNALLAATSSVVPSMSAKLEEPGRPSSGVPLSEPESPFRHGGTDALDRQQKSDVPI